MLTVVLTTRGRSTRLGKTLDAYERLAPPRGGWKLVVVDDGSADATPSLLAARAPRFAPEAMVVVRTPPIGQNAARNRAFAALAGDLVVFTDDDATPRPDWLVRVRDAADAHPEVDVIAGTVLARFEVAPPDFVLRAVRKGPAFSWVERPADGYVDPTEAVGSSFAVRKSRFAAGLRFEETIGPNGTGNYAMGSETELLLRLQRSGAKAWYAKDAIVEHYVSASQVEPDSLVGRAYRYGRGRWRLRTSRLATKRVGVRGLPLALLADLLSRRLSFARAKRRGDAEGALRAAWRIAYLAGHVAEIRRERGEPGGLGTFESWVPSPIRDAIASATRPANACASAVPDRAPVHSGAHACP